MIARTYSPSTGAITSEIRTGYGYEWSPNDSAASPADSHDQPYEAPDGDPPTTGPVPENIVAD